MLRLTTPTARPRLRLGENAPPGVACLRSGYALPPSAYPRRHSHPDCRSILTLIVAGQVGRVIGVLTLTPYDFWRRKHAIHHSTSGNLDRRGIGDVDTLTVREYLSRSGWGRMRYRIYRHPLVMFGFGPAYLFIVEHRIPIGLMRNGWMPWLSTMGTNVAIVALVATIVWFVGIGAFLLVHIPIMLLAASVGVWLFYVQHQFENTVWAHDRAWNLQEVALHGSSHYALPSLLRWFTANIGIHHIHHLCSRIPYYRLPLVLRDYPDLDGIGRLTLVQSLRCVRLALWDEGQKRLVSFREMRGNCAQLEGDAGRRS